jgi:hypothetical protein
MNTRNRDRWTPEARKAHGELTKARMASLAVRQKISERTKAGMRAADPQIAATRAELSNLCAAWDEASSEARQKFLLTVLSAARGASLTGSPQWAK